MSLFRKFFFLPTFIIILVSFSTLAYGVFLGDENSGNRPGAVTPAGNAPSKGPEYVPNEIIVKLKHTESPKALYTMSYSTRESLDTNILASIKTKYNLNNEAPVFKDLHQKLKSKNTSQLQLDANINAKVSKSSSLVRTPTQSTPSVDLLPIYVLNTDQDVKTVCNKLKEDPDVEYAEPNYIMKVQMVPNDPYYQSQGSWGQSYYDLWGIKKIGCEQAWDISQGEGVVVAVIDTGVDYNHPDLAANIWTNAKEIPGNGIDDDGNGYVDDVRGWDFAYGDNDPMDGFGHGTHCAGTIAAVGNNNVGVVGVAPKAKIMIVKGLDDNGSGATSNLATCVIYAADNGANVLSNSWGGSGTSQVLTDAFHYADSKGCVCVAAAGNDNTDVAGFSPANIDTVITVAARDQNDEKCSFSNWGAKIDIAAPGGGTGSSVYNILSTMPDICTLANEMPNLKISDGYYRLAGTSMACPHVSGVAALVRSLHPDFTNKDVFSVLRASADNIVPESPGVYPMYGRVNGARSLAINLPCLASIISPPSGGYITDTGAIEIRGTASGSGFDHYILEYEAGVGQNSWTEIVSGRIPVIDDILTTWDASGIDVSSVVLRLTVYNSAGVAFAAYSQICFVKNLHDGWPISIKSFVSPAVLADLDGDDINDIIFSTFLAMDEIAALKSDGTYISGWPRAFQGIGGSLGNPAIGDIDGDLDQEVVFSDGEIYVYALRADGTAVPGWPKAFPVNGTGGVISDPVLADLNGDGVYEIIAAFSRGNSDYLCAWDGHGNVINGWPRIMPLQRTSSWVDHVKIAASDIDNDGKSEIFVVDTSTDSACMIFNGSGELLKGWPVYLPAGVSAQYSDLVLGDITGDGIPEMFFSTSRSDNNALHNMIYAFRSDGTPVQGWPINRDSIFPDGGGYIGLGGIVLSDLNGDKTPEIIIRATCGDGSMRIAVFQSDGSLMSGWPFSFSDGGGLIVADIDGDLQPEIIFGSSGGVHALSAAGKELSGWPRFAPCVGASVPAIGDMNGDLKSELVISSSRGGPGSTQLFLYDLTAADNPLISQWPMFMHDPQHSGHYVPPPNIAAPAYLKAKAESQGEITLQWTNRSDNENGFKIYRCSSAYGQYTQVAAVGVNETTYHNTGLQPSANYYYKIQAYNSTDRSGYSNVVKAMTLPISPTAPSDLSLVTVSQTEATIRWADNSNNEDGFYVERRTSEGGDFIKIANPAPNVTSYTDRGLSSETTYFYKVKAYNSGGDSGDSNTITVVTLLGVPTAPSDLIAVPVSASQIDLSWKDNSDHEDGFKIEQADLMFAGRWLEVGTVPANTNSFSHTGLQGSTKYTYRVRAYNSAGYSGYSVTVQATTYPPPPAAPTGLIVPPQIYNSRQLKIQWQDNADNEEGFKIERSLTGVENDFAQIAQIGPSTSAIPGIVTYTDTGLSSGKTYYYRVRAYSAAGNSAWSNISSGTTSINHVPVIAIDPPGNKTADVNKALTFTITISDTDISDNFSLLPVTLPEGATLTQTREKIIGQRSIVFAWTPAIKQAGAYPLTFTVSDGELSASAAITITVNKVNSPPQVGTVTPSNGSSNPDQAVTFTTVYSDPDGWQDMQWAFFIVNSAPNGANGLYVYYSQNTNKLYLRDDSGNTWMGGFSPGSNNIIENSYARLDCSKTTVVGSDTTLTVNWSVSFKAPFTGQKNTYLYAYDDAGAADGWTQKGTWSIANKAPSVGTITPSSGSSVSNQAVTFTTASIDPDGWQNLQYVFLLINKTVDGSKGLYVYYYQDSNKLYLRDDSGTNWLGGFAPGSGNIIENSYVKLDCSKTTVSGSGTTLAIGWSITFKPTFTGQKNIYLYVKDDAGATNGWTQKGNWLIK